MGRVYTVSFENVAVSVAQDFLEVTPADDKPIALIGYEIDNVGGTSDAGDGQEELLRCSWVTGHATSGSGGSSATPRPVDPNDAAAGFSAEVNNTTIASAGTAVTRMPFGLNIRIPGPLWLPERAWLHASQADVIAVVRLLAAPADSISLSGAFWILEK